MKIIRERERDLHMSSIFNEICNKFVSCITLRSIKDNLFTTYHFIYKNTCEIHSCLHEIRTIYKQIVHYHISEFFTSNLNTFGKTHIAISLIRNTVWNLSHTGLTLFICCLLTGRFLDNKYDIYY